MFIPCDLLIFFLSNYALKYLVHSYFDDITVENRAVENAIPFLHGGVENGPSHTNNGDVVSPHEIILLL